MAHEHKAVIVTGQVWYLVYGGQKVRMRVAGIARDGQCTLVEETPSDVYTRVLVTSASNLWATGELAPPDEEPTDPNFKVPEERTEAEDDSELARERARKKEED